MLKDINKYKKALQNIKINKIDFLAHTIDKDKVIKSYKNYQTNINECLDFLDADLDCLVRYEKWLGAK